MNLDIFKIEADAVQILIGVSELRAKETDGPRNLNPEHEQRQGRKRTVDGVVARHPYLRVDISNLQQVHRNTRKYTWYDGTREADLCIGHINI